MAVTVLIPTPLRTFTDGRDRVQLEAATVGQLLERLAAEPAALRAHLFAEGGRLGSFVNVFGNDRDIRPLGRQDTPGGPDDTVAIVPGIAGGRGGGGEETTVA